MTSTIRTFPLAMLAACALASTSAQADHGAAPGNYFGVHGGINGVRGSWDADVRLGPGVNLPGALATKRGTHFGLFGGRQTGHARFELEYQRGTFDITRLQLGPVSQAVATGGDYSALTANAYRFEPLTQRINVYGAIGIGWGRVALPQMSFTAPPGSSCMAAR